MSIRRMVSVGVFAVGIPLSHATAERPQELPMGVADALMAYFASEYAEAGSPLAVEVDGFPSPSGALSLARSKGLTAGYNEDLIVCSADRRVCRLQGGRRIVRFMGFQVEVPGRQVLVRVIVSQQWESPDGTAARLLPTLRHLTLSNDRGWHVTGDVAAVRGD